MSGKHVHQSYIIRGLVDGAVVHKQAQRRRDVQGETTVVHQHGRGQTCTDKCMIYEKGYKPRQVNVERVPE